MAFLDGKKLAQGLNREALEAYWMPFTGNRHFKNDPRMIVGAAGAYFADDKGRKVYDSLSGLWCTPLGHADPDIVAAVGEQIGTLACRCQQCLPMPPAGNRLVVT